MGKNKITKNDSRLSGTRLRFPGKNVTNAADNTELYARYLFFVCCFLFLLNGYCFF